MKPVWAKLAKLQDPDGFINHVSEYVQEQYHRRHNAGEDPNVNRRGKPLCRCDRSRHVCEVKQGEVPSKIRTQDLMYLNKPDSRTLAREYVQEHSGDVVVREAMEDFRNLRADIYGELSDILAMMMGRDEPQDSEDTSTDASSAASEPSDPSPSDGGGGADAATASADGGEEPDPSEVVDAALASAVDRHGADALAEQATEGAMTTLRLANAVQNGEISAERLARAVEGDEGLNELAAELDGADGEDSGVELSHDAGEPELEPAPEDPEDGGSDE